MTWRSEKHIKICQEIRKLEFIGQLEAENFLKKRISAPLHKNPVGYWPCFEKKDFEKENTEIWNWLVINKLVNQKSWIGVPLCELLAFVRNQENSFYSALLNFDQGNKHTFKWLDLNKQRYFKKNRMNKRVPSWKFKSRLLNQTSISSMLY